MSAELVAYQGEEHQPFLWEGVNGAAALLVHGFPGSPAEMRPVAQILHDQGWTVQGMLLPGFGPDFPQLERYSSQEWLGAVERTARQLSRDHDQVLLVGNSMGAALSMQAAAQGTGQALLLFAPFWRAFNRWIDAAFPLARLIMREVKPFQKADFSDQSFREGVHRFLPQADLDDPAVQEAVRELSLPLSVLGEVRKAGQGGYRSASQVRQPAAIIQGEADPVADAELTRKIADRLPNLVGLTMLQAGHDLTLLEESAVRDEIVETVRTYAANLQRPASVASTP